MVEEVTPGAPLPGAGSASGDEERALGLARTLLAADRVGVRLEERPPDPPLDALRARAGFGAVATGHDVRISVYVLEAWAQGHEHVRTLTEQAQAAGREVSTAVNGTLLFVGTAPGDDSDAELVLAGLASAFAGRE